MFRRQKPAPALYDSAAPPKVGKVRQVTRWWLRSTKTLIFSAVLMAILAATAVYLIVFPAKSGPAQPIASPVAAGSAQVAPQVTASPSPAVGCAEQPAVQVPPETLVLTTYSTQWYAIGGMLTPRSTVGGPSQGQQCFARTPEGALYAIATRVAIEANKAGVSGRQFSGYQWLSYSPHLATVSIAARAVNGDNAEPGTARTFTATWVGNDWQVSVLDQPVEYLDGLRTFTIWGGA